nr:hypothetical protein [Neobacillus dielmonensis]
MTESIFMDEASEVHLQSWHRDHVKVQALSCKDVPAQPLSE